MMDVLTRVVWGPWWGPEQADIALHFTVCEEVDTLKPYWMELLTNVLKILLTLLLFGPPTDSASASTTLTNDIQDFGQKQGGSSKLKTAGKGSFLALALGTCAADCWEIWKLHNDEGRSSTWWMQYQCSAIVWITSPNFCSACAAFALWYLAHVRLNITNNLPYARYGLNVYSPGTDGVLSAESFKVVEKSHLWFCSNLRGWWFALTQILWRQGRAQAIYITFLSVVYVLPSLTIFLATHLVSGFVLTAFPSVMLCAVVKVCSDFLTEKYVYWGLTTSYDGVVIEPTATASELYDILAETYIDPTCNARIREDWVSEGMDGEYLRCLSDTDLRNFLLQVRYPFKKHARILSVTRNFRKSGELVVPGHMYVDRIELSEGVAEENVQSLINEDRRHILQTGVPDLAWKTYLFLAIAGSVLAPTLLLVAARFYRGDGLIASFWMTVTERKTMKYWHHIRRELKSQISTASVGFFTKQIWSWL